MIARLCLVAIGALVCAVPAPARVSVLPPPVDSCATARVCTEIEIVSGDATYENGAGTVTSSPAGLNCRVDPFGALSGTCKAEFRSQVLPSLTVTIIKTPDPGNSWRTCTSGCQDVETLTAGLDRVVVPVAFEKPVVWTLAKSGTGSGTIAVRGCDGCTRIDLPYGSLVTLTASPDVTSRFTDWSGDCSGKGTVCEVTVLRDQTISANFELQTPPAGGGGGGSGSPPPGPSPAPGPGGAPPPATSDTTLDAQLVAVRTARSKLGARIVVVELTADEQVSVDVFLRRGAKTIATRHVGRFVAQDGTLVLPIARTTKAGASVVQVKLADAAGNASIAGRSLQLPKAAVAKRKKAHR
jgi:hypothetical protein